MSRPSRRTLTWSCSLSALASIRTRSSPSGSVQSVRMFWLTVLPCSTSMVVGSPRLNSGRLVFVRADDVERDAAGGGEPAAVGGVVGEGFGAGFRVGRDGDLEGGAAVDVLEARRPAGPLPPTEAVRTSPSGSESLSSTERMVVRPGRTPTASGVVSGGRLGLVRSGRMLMVLLSADSWSWSSDWFLGGMTSSQLLTSCMFWLTSHTLPEFTSLRTTRSRFTRNTYDGDALALGTSTVLSSASSTHSRTYLFAPDHAACTHPPSCTGAAGTPCPPNATVFAVEPSNGWCNSAFGVATATASAAGPVSCSFASRASASANSRPPGRNNFPRPASSTTGRSPTTASCKSPAPFNPSHDLHRRIRNHTLRIQPTSPSPARTSDPHCKSGHQHPPRTPSRPNPSTPARNSPHQNHSPSTATTPTPCPSPRPSPHMTSDPKLTSADPGNFLSPPNRICAADTWFNVEPALSSTNTVPASCNTSNVVPAGVTAPSNTRDG